MSFDCSQYVDGYCKMQKGNCVPAIGKCILKGKLMRGRDIENEINGLKNKDQSQNSII